MKSFRDQGPLHDFEAFDRRRRSCALLSYAAVDWGWHVRQAKCTRTTELALTLLQNESARMAACQAFSLDIIDEQTRGIERIERFEDHNGKVSFGSLHVAAYFGLIDAAAILLKGSAKVDELDGFGGTPLHWALIGRQDEMLEFLLVKGADPNFRRGEFRLRKWSMIGIRTLPLTVAASMGNTAAIQTLLEYGADIDKVDNDTNPVTAFSVSLFAGELEAAAMLLARGADVRIDPRGSQLAARRGDLRILRFVIESRISAASLQDMLIEAASSGQSDSIMLLLKYGADPNGSSHSSTERNPTNQPLLIDKISTTVGIDVGQTATSPLVAAIAFENPYKANNEDQQKCLQILLDAGADVNRLSHSDYFYADDILRLECEGWRPSVGRLTTPLLTAAYFQRPDNIRELVRRGANVNIMLGEHNTALSSAMSREGYGSFDDPDCIGYSTKTRATVQLLIELGADPNLCVAKVKSRIEELLAMSPEECKQLDELQNVVFLSRFDPNRRSFRERRDKLRELIAQQAEPKLACERDRQIIEDFLSWSEREIDTRDTFR